MVTRTIEALLFLGCALALSAYETGLIKPSSPGAADPSTRPAVARSGTGLRM